MYNLRDIKLGLVPKTVKAKKPIKPRSPIPKRSIKTKEQYKGYKKQMTAYLAKEENEFCKIRMAGCTGRAQCVHHTAGRIGDKLTDESDWMPSCLSCNLTVEINDKEAREKGFKKSKFLPPVLIATYKPELKAIIVE